MLAFERDGFTSSVIYGIQCPAECFAWGRVGSVILSEYKLSTTDPMFGQT